MSRRSYLIALMLTLLSPLCALGQYVGPGSGNGISTYTVATLPTGLATNTLAVVSDGSGQSCTVGGSSTHVLCQYNGVAWVPVSGGSGAAPAFSAVTTGTNASALLMGTGGSLGPTGSGTITATAMPYSGLTSLPAACGANLFATQIAATPGCTLVNFANLSGSIALAQTPLTTSGDILVANATPALARLATGTAHQLLHGGNSWSLVDLTSDVVNALPAGSLSGTLAAAQFPVLAGDVTTPGASLTTTVVKVNGNSIPSGAAVHQVAVATASSTLAWKTITDCNGSSNALNYTQSTDLFSCNNIATLSNPMTTLGDMIDGGASGAVTRLAGPSTPNGLAYTLVSVPASGAATAPVWTLAGVPVNSQTGAGYTIVATDRANYLSLSNASAQTLTLPAIAGNFASNLPFVVQNIGAGTWTITPTTQTINGNSTDAIVTKLAAFVYQDNSPNWFDIVFPTVQAFPSCTDSAGNHLNWNSATRLFTCGTTSSGGAFYQTVDANASAQTQRPTLNLISGTNATVTCVDNSGSTRTDCTISASSSAGSRLDQITGGTATNTINSTTFAQVWNWALTGSQIGFTFGENTAATGSGNIILDAQTLAASTALPFQTTARGTANGWNLSTGALWEPIGTGALATGLTAHSVPINEGGTTAIAAVGPGTAKQIFISGGGAADPSYIDYPEVLDIPAANCNNATGGAGWSIPASSAPTVACRAGSNNLGGVLQFADAANAQFDLAIPGDWDTAALPFIKLFFTDSANTSGTEIFQAQVSCYVSDFSATDDIAFAAAQVFTTRTATAANRSGNENLQFNSTSMNGCVAGGNMIVKITRNTDTAASAVNVSKATITFPRLVTVQAN
jgi:hypothetical protein